MPSWYVFDALTNRPQRVRQIWRLWVIWDRDFWLSAHVTSSDIMTHSRTQFSIRFSSDFALYCNSFANSSGKSHNLLCQTLGTLPSPISRTSRGPIMATLSSLPPSTIGYLQYMMMIATQFGATLLTRYRLWQLTQWNSKGIHASQLAVLGCRSNRVCFTASQKSSCAAFVQRTLTQYSPWHQCTFSVA